MIIQKTVFKVSDFLVWQRAGDLHLSPAFQRRPVWPSGAKSLLIDTVVSGIPMPIIFLRELIDLKKLVPKRQVVDGQQRLRTLITYIEPAALPDYEPARDDFTVKAVHNKELADKRFEQLTDWNKKRILDYEFSVHVLPSDTDDRDVLQIFARMNSTGYKLNDQELRNAEYYGSFKSASYELAYEQLSRWRAWRVCSETDLARMIEVEETSDLLITMLQGIHGRTQKLLTSTYKKFDDAFPARAEVERRFREVMDRIDDAIGVELPETPFHRRALFNTLFTYFYDILYGLNSKLTSTKARRIDTEAIQAVQRAAEEISAGNLPEELAKVLRGATGDFGARKRRLEFIQRRRHRV